MKSERELDLEDLAEQAEEVGFLSPIEYARLRGVKPQIVYYYIRRGHIKDERCKCGRRIVEIATADAYLQEAQEARRRRSGQPVLKPDRGVGEEGHGPPVQELSSQDTMEAFDD